MTQSAVSVISALAGAAVGAILAASFVYLNIEIQKKIKKSDLYRLLKAEILNLKRHCSISFSEIDHYGSTDSAAIKTMKYKDGSTLLLDTKELYLLNENICQDIMQISLLSRNNDIYIDDVLNLISRDSVDITIFTAKIKNIKYRMKNLNEICEAVLGNLDKFFHDPKRYNEPIIDWQ